MKTSLRVAVRVASVVAVLLVLPRFAHAAGEETGRIIGRVFEEQTGAPVPGAAVTATGASLIGAPRTATTADDGTFQLPNLPGGVYDVEVAYSGVKPIKRRILVRPAEAAPLEIAWSAELASVETTVVQEERHLTKPDTAVAGATFSMEKQNFLPVARQYQSVVTQAPGVNENAGGNPRVKGASDRDNRVLIDGLDTTDPVTNTFSANIGQDSLAAVQVLTSGFEAKYNALGSIINLITNSGSDEYHFNISFYARPRQLQTFQTSGSSGATYELSRIYDPTPQPPSKTYQANFNVGGPIIKHQLWFNVGAEIDYNSTVNPPGPPLNRLAPNRVFQDIFPQGKLTWAPSSQHKLMIEALGDPAYIDYENNGGATANTTEPIASVGRFQGGYKVLGEWDYFITQNFDLKVLGGYSFNKLDVGPQGQVRSVDAKDGIYPGFTAPRHSNQLDATFWRNALNEQITNRNRFQLDSALSWRGRTGEVSHEAETGIQSAYTYDFSQNIFTGLGDSYQDQQAGAFLNTALCDADPTLTPAGGPTGLGCNQRTHNNDTSTLRRGVKVGIYLQDRIKPTTWLTLIPGIRWDISRIWLPGGVPDFYHRTVNINGRMVQTSDFQTGNGFGPRFSAIFDITRDQKTIFQASYGRTSEDVYLTVLGSVDGAYKGQATVSTWNPATRTFQPLPVGGTPNDVLLDSSSRNLPHADELFLRFSRELFKNAVGEIDYTYKYYSNILDSAEVNRIWDPSGSRINGYVDPTRQTAVFVFTNDDRNWQKYSGLDFIFEARPTQNLDFYGSYTLGWTWGPGYQENALFGTGFAGQFYNPRQNQFYFGFSPTQDVRHQVKTQTVYQFHGFVVGATVNWRSGFALTRQYPVNSGFDVPRYRSPLGTDPSAPNSVNQWTELRLPDLFTVSLRIGYDFYELTRQHLLVDAQMTNLFNNFTPTGLQLVETAPPSGFGRVNARPAVFQTQLGIRYTY